MIYAEVRVRTDQVTNEFADIFLYIGGVVREWIDIQYTSILDRCGTNWMSPAAHDLLVFLASVYALDRSVRRQHAPDGWTREFMLTVPVQTPQFIEAAPRFEECLSFLTGDLWHLHFVLRPLAHGYPLVQPKCYRWRSDSQSFDAISLYSGGLDSLIGIIDWLESHPGRLLLMGHHDAGVPGPYREQRRMLPILTRAYPGRVEAMLVRVGVRVPDGGEMSFRARNCLLRALMLQAYTMIFPRPALLAPDNGPITFNVPYWPSRRGTCSTRTTHPYYVDLFEQAIAMLDLSAHYASDTRARVGFINPLLYKTKGEAVKACLNRPLLEALVPYTNSCGKRGHRVSWIRRTATHCGCCPPCFVRRSALHTIRLDTEAYGVDICAGELSPSHRGAYTRDAAADMRALFAYLHSDTSLPTLERQLLVGGGLTLSQVRAGAAVVARGTEEVRTWLREKGSRKIRRYAGLNQRRSVTGAVYTVAR